jgi:hypothetical protein
MDKASPTSPCATSPPSPFLTLPREIRDKIYRSLLVQETALRASCPDCGVREHEHDNDLYFTCKLSDGEDYPKRISDLQILRVNSQIHAEA